LQSCKREITQIWVQVREDSKRISETIYLGACWNLLSKYGDLKQKKSSKSGSFGIFFSQNTLYEFHYFFFGHQVAKNRRKNADNDESHEYKTFVR
jgi:hypothetical protein